MRAWLVLVVLSGCSPSGPGLDDPDEIPLKVAQRIGLEPHCLQESCKRHHIGRSGLCGSVLREDFGPGSDVDVVVEFEPGKTPGLAFFGIQDELSALIGREVDLVVLNGAPVDLTARVLRSER